LFQTGRKVVGERTRSEKRYETRSVGSGVFVLVPDVEDRNRESGAESVFWICPALTPDA
jgi:hypothetical protein